MKIQNITKFQLDEAEIINFLDSQGLLPKDQKVMVIRYDGVKKCLIITCGISLAGSEVEPNKINNLEGIKNELLDLAVTELDISIKTLKLLRNADLYMLRDLLEKGESFLRKIYGFGPISMLDIKNALHNKGLELTK